MHFVVFIIGFSFSKLCRSIEKWDCDYVGHANDWWFYSFYASA